MVLRPTTTLQFWLLSCDIFIGQVVLFSLPEHTIESLHKFLGPLFFLPLVIEATLKVV